MLRRVHGEAGAARRNPRESGGAARVRQRRVGMTKAAARPRRLGILDLRGARAAPPPRANYPYPLGYRVSGDLTVTGHLATGRAGHLYQVWSARDWCAYTCKIIGPDRVG